MFVPAVCTIEDEVHMGWGRGRARGHGHPTWNVTGACVDCIQTSSPQLHAEVAGKSKKNVSSAKQTVISFRYLASAG